MFGSPFSGLGGGGRRGTGRPSDTGNIPSSLPPPPPPPPSLGFNPTTRPSNPTGIGGIGASSSLPPPSLGFNPFTAASNPTGIRATGTPSSLPPPSLGFKSTTGASKPTGIGATGTSSSLAPPSLGFNATMTASNPWEYWETGTSLPPAPPSVSTDPKTGAITQQVPEGTGPTQSPPSPPSRGSTAHSQLSDVFIGQPSGPPAIPPSDPKKSPAKSPFASKGVSNLQNSGIFSNTYVPGSGIEQMIQNDTNLPDTPSKTNKDDVAQLQQQINSAADDASLLEDLRRRERAVRGNRTQPERKQEQRNLALPWIESGLNYRGIQRPGLFREDGTRNPERPRKGSGTRPPPVVPPGTGPGTGPSGPPPPPPDTGNKNNQGTTSSSGTGTTGTDGGRATKPKAKKRDSTSNSRGGVSKTTTTATGGTKVTTGTMPGGINGPSPLRNSVTAGDLGIPDPRAPVISVPTTLGTGGAPWQARNDLFLEGVMRAAGITAALDTEQMDALPTLPSSIVYDVENWEM